MEPIRLSFNQYKPQFAKLPVDDFARSVEGFNQEYLKGVEAMSMADQLARSINVSEQDTPEKERRLRGIHEAIDKFSKTGNFEDAPMAAAKLASTLRNDQWLQSAQERYSGMMEDMKKANELDISDAQRYALQKYFKEYGITPTQKSKLGTYGRYVSFDVFKEPDIQQELSKFMKEAEATYTQKINDNGEMVYVKGNEVKTKEDLLKLGMQYIASDPKMSRLLQWETDMHADASTPEVKRAMIQSRVSELKQMKKTLEKQDMSDQADYYGKVINQIQANASDLKSLDKLYRSLIQEQLLNKHTSHLAEAFAKDRETISNLRLRDDDSSGSGNSSKLSGIDYFGYTGRGSNTFIDIVDDRSNPSVAELKEVYKEVQKPNGKWASVEDWKNQRKVQMDKRTAELDSFYKSPDFQSIKQFANTLPGITVASPEVMKKSARQISEEIVANSANIPAPKIRLGDRSMKLLGVQEDQNGRPIGGDNSFTLMLPKENGGGSYSNLGNLQALEESIRKTMGKVEDVKFTYTKQGISPANPQGMPGAVVYTVTATGKGDKGADVSMDFDVLRSNDNERIGQAFKPLQYMASFAYSGKPGVQTFDFGSEQIKLVNVPTIAENGTITLSSMVSSTNPARKPMTFENFINDYSMQIFNNRK